MKRANIVMLSALLSFCFAGGHAYGHPWAVVDPQTTSSGRLSSALDQLQGHMEGTAPRPGPDLLKIGELIVSEGE